jgi:uncharacterized protein YbjT (DUF2867 family)
MGILVTGVTGTIGSQVLAHLAGQAIEVRASTRSPETAKLPAGIIPIGGDLAEVDSLRVAMKGVDTLFLLAPNVADELTQSMLALSVAREGGIKGIVYLSVFNGDTYADATHEGHASELARHGSAIDVEPLPDGRRGGERG